MALGIYTLLEAGLLFVNAIAILNEKRFLAKYITGATGKYNGGGNPYGGAPGFGDDTPGVRSQGLTLVRSVHTVLRVPLIFINFLVIIVKLLLG